MQKNCSNNQVKAKPYVKNLSAGTWKAGEDIKEGLYKIPTNSGSGNLFISGNGYDSERDN